MKPAIALFIISACIVFSSCTIQKRRYMDGYHVEWHHGQQRQVTLTQDPKTTAPVDTLTEITMEKDTTLLPAMAKTPDESYREEDNVKPKHRSKKEGEHKGPARSLVYGIFGGVPIARSLAPESGSQLATVFSIIAVILVVLAVISLILALSITEGWAALGWIALAFIAAAAAFPFALVAQIIFWRKGESTPFYQWISLIIGLIGFIVTIGVLLGM